MGIGVGCATGGGGGGVETRGVGAADGAAETEAEGGAEADAEAGVDEATAADNDEDPTTEDGVPELFAVFRRLGRPDAVTSGSGVGVVVGVSSWNWTALRRIALAAFLTSGATTVFLPLGARATTAGTVVADPAPLTSISCLAMSTRSPLPFFLPIPLLLLLLGANCDTTRLKSINCFLCK